ncbi:MAG: FUSC family protein [Bryobacteraceae bacterium]
MVSVTLLNQIDRATGLRLTAACMGPLVLGYVLGNPQAGVLTGVGGLWVGLADSGGTYRTRATALAITAIGITVTALIGAAVASIPILAIPLMCAFAFSAAMLTVYGNAPSAVGSLLMVSYMFAVGSPSTVASAWSQAGYTLLGALWAGVLSLYLWPIRPYLPVQEAIAKAYREAAKLLKGVEHHVAAVGDGGPRWSTTLGDERAAVAAAVQSTRDLTASLRTRRQGATFIGQDLLILTRYSDRLLTSTIALAETLDIAADRIHFAHIRDRVRLALERIAAAAESIADAAEKGGGRIDLADMEAAVKAVDEAISHLRDASEDLAAEFPSLLALRNLDRAFRAVAEYVATAADVASTLGKPRRLRAHHGEDSDDDPANVARARLRDNLSFDSLTFRHALRLAVACSASVAVATILRIDHGAWISLTVAVILKPDFGGTRDRAIQRVAGTVAGGLVGIAIAHSVHNIVLILAILIFFSFATFSQMSLEYHRFVFFLTPFVVILISLGHPGDWHIGLTRMANTLAGGLIALAAGYTLWPSWALESLPEQMARCVAANRRYFRAVIDGYLGRTAGPQALRQAHEEAQVENSNVSVSFQRLLSDPAHRQGSVEPYYALVSYNQRFCDDVTTLSAYQQWFSGQSQLPGLDSFAIGVEAMLSNLEKVLRNEAALSVVPGFEDSLCQMTEFVEQLAKARAVEIAAKRIDTRRRQALRDVSALPAELRRLAEELTGMTLAVRRLKTSSPWLLTGIRPDLVA